MSDFVPSIPLFGRAERLAPSQGIWSQNDERYVESDAPFVARVTTDAQRLTTEPHREVLLCDSRGAMSHGTLREGSSWGAPRFRAAFVREPQDPEAAAASPSLENLGGASEADSRCPVYRLPQALSYLGEGDVVRFEPRTGNLRALFRRSSPNNALFVTERCNSKCLMCSQPPRPIDDGYLVDELLDAIPLIDPATPTLGITGGESTLLGTRFLDLLRCAKEHLSDTRLDVLTNGRLFSYLARAQAVADVDHPRLILCVPLYSDDDVTHDFVVQAKGAWAQTVRGLMNLGRVGVAVEVRVVLHRQTVARLPQLAKFLARNFPFVSHVALMGLEMTGFTRANLEALWIDPADYVDELSEAVTTLSWAGIPTSIYNHQLCLLPPALWSFARRSISDWKNIYMPECEGCDMREECGGFFASARLRYSGNIRPISA